MVVDRLECFCGGFVLALASSGLWAVLRKSFLIDSDGDRGTQKPFSIFLTDMNSKILFTAVMLNLFTITRKLL